MINAHKLGSRNLEERDHVCDLCVKERMILLWIYKYDMTRWAELNSQLDSIKC
jgi:hypothetical protein